MEAKRKNPRFLSPISITVQNILDVGHGSGIWVKEIADMYSSAVVYGVDLSPPPQEWVPPNCRLEVDDVLKPWDYTSKFDFVHMRDLFGSFSNEQWRLVYKQAYNDSAPGGWIEQLETEVARKSDNGSLPTDCILANWGTMFNPLCEKMDKPVDTFHHMKSRIETAGFTNVHEKLYKVPFGEWAKGAAMKEAGRFHAQQFLGGMEGYAMFLLTHFGEPTPWAPEEVQVFLAKVRQEINDPSTHAYSFRRRVWARKPLNKAQ